MNELEWVEGYVLANIWYSDRIAVIDPDPNPDLGEGLGEVVMWLDLLGII